MKHKSKNRKPRKGQRRVLEEMQWAAEAVARILDEEIQHEPDLQEMMQAGENNLQQGN